MRWKRWYGQHPKHGRRAQASHVRVTAQGISLSVRCVSAFSGEPSLLDMFGKACDRPCEGASFSPELPAFNVGPAEAQNIYEAHAWLTPRKQRFCLQLEESKKFQEIEGICLPSARQGLLNINGQILEVVVGLCARRLPPDQHRRISSSKRQQETLASTLTPQRA